MRDFKSEEGFSLLNSKLLLFPHPMNLITTKHFFVWLSIWMVFFILVANERFQAWGTRHSNIILDKSCEPGEPMIGNHKVVHCKPKSMKNKIFHWAILILAASSTAHSAQFGGFLGLCTTGPPKWPNEIFCSSWIWVCNGRTSLWFPIIGSPGSQLLSRWTLERGVVHTLHSYIHTGFKHIRCFVHHPIQNSVILQNIN